MPRPVQSLKAKALACIAQREHSRHELRRKLLAHASRLVGADVAPNWDGAGPSDSPEVATEALALAQAESQAELQTEAEAAIDALLAWLAAKDLLSEERFVETRVQARVRRFGNLRIHQELAQHGVQLDPQTSQALKQSELGRARALWEKRFGTRAEDPLLRAKQARFLMARGFSADVVRRVVTARDDAT
jgi:regulatory protein